MIVQGFVVTVLLVIPALGIGNIDSFLEMLINMTAATSLLPVLFLLAAYIGLRWKKDDMPRDFRFGSRKFGIAAGIFLLIVFAFVFFMSTVPEPALLCRQSMEHCQKELQIHWNIGIQCLRYSYFHGIGMDMLESL